MAKYVRKRIIKDGLYEYNSFCKSLREGDILYNIDTTNKWGSLLLVAAKIAIAMNSTETYSLLLLGLKKDSNKKIIPNGERVDITPQKVFSTPFLRVVGHCEYNLIPNIDKTAINQGLVVVFENINLKKAHFRKPRTSKYGDDGEPNVKSTTNKNETKD